MTELSIVKFVPDIINEILFFFAYNKDDPEKDFIAGRTISKLEGYLSKKYDTGQFSLAKELIYICDKICEIIDGFYCINRGGFLGYDNAYYWAGGPIDTGTLKRSHYFELSKEERKVYVIPLENAVYGSRYIYEQYKDYVIPIVYKNMNDEDEIGTGFLYGNNTIITARHCIENSKSISFGTLDFDSYRNASVYYHKNNCIDVAVIRISELSYCGFDFDTDADIFDRVITMGYPKIPGYTCFKTAEEAFISAVPEKRLTVSEGAIAANAQEIWSRENLFLITAKIKGGNSGGPVIDRFGNCIGVVSALPDSEGDKYDDLGYGTVIPARFALEMINDLSQHQLIEHINFSQYNY